MILCLRHSDRQAIGATHIAVYIAGSQPGLKVTNPTCSTLSARNIGYENFHPPPVHQNIGLVGFGGRMRSHAGCLCEMTKTDNIEIVAVCARDHKILNADMERKDCGPWNIYGTPVEVEKSTFARAGLRSLHVVTDNEDTMGGNYEGTSRCLGEFQAGDEIRVSFWYWVNGGRKIVVGLGPGYFQGRWVLSGTDWTQSQVSLRCTKAGRYHIWISQAADAAEFFVDDFTVEVVKRPDLGTAEKAQRTELTGGPLRLTLCRQTGALCGIENTATGETYASVGQRQPLFGLEREAGRGRVPNHQSPAGRRLGDGEGWCPVATALRRIVAGADDDPEWRWRGVEHIYAAGKGKGPVLACPVYYDDLQLEEMK